MTYYVIIMGDEYVATEVENLNELENKIKEVIENDYIDGSGWAHVYDEDNNFVMEVIV